MTSTTLIQQKLPEWTSETLYSEGYPHLAEVAIDKIAEVVPGIITGAITDYFYNLGGLGTAIHEYLGHGVLGYKLLYDGKETEAVINQWEAFKEIIEAEHGTDKASALFRWITFNKQGGHISARGGELNALGLRIGESAATAWIAIAGSVPGLVLNSLSVTTGMVTKDRYPFLGYSLISFGIVEHLLNSSYPISAAFMSDNGLLQSALHQGHDFARFALSMSEVTGFSARSIAITTAIGWTVSVPAVAVIAYFAVESSQTEFIPDCVAFQRWYSEIKNDDDKRVLYEKLVNDYPDQTLFSRKAPSEYDLYLFADYLINALPPSELNKTKKRIIKEWGDTQKPDIVSHLITAASVVGTISTIASKVLTIVAETIAPALSHVAAGFSYMVPIFFSVSIISDGYQTFKDLTADYRYVPISAKVLSVAKLVVTVVSTTGILVGMFVPGLQLLLLGSTGVSIVGSVALSFARQRVIKNRFDTLQAIEPSVWKHNIVGYKHKDSQTKLFKWAERVRDAEQEKLLSDEQQTQWNKIAQTA